MMSTILRFVSSGKHSSLHLLPASMWNSGMCKRFENVGEGDVARNALTILNVGGLMLNMELESGVDSLKYLFN